METSTASVSARTGRSNVFVSQGGSMGAIVWRHCARLGRVLLANLVYMYAPVALVLPIGLWVGSLPAAVVGVILWLGSSAYAVDYAKGAVNGWSILCATIPICMIGLVVGDYAALVTGPVVRGVAVADAPLYPEAGAFEFRDAQIQPAYEANYRTTARRKTGGTSTTSYCVAPLTGPDWTPADPVPAWVGCTESAGCCAGVVVGNMRQGGMEEAVALAQQIHGLRGAPGAPVLEWVDSVESAMRNRRFMFVFAAVSGYALWALPVLIGMASGFLLDLWSYWRAAR